MSFDVELESLRAIITAAIVLFMWRAGRKERFFALNGWWQIIFGFTLILFASLLDITDNFPELNHFIVIGDTETEAFLEKFVGYLGGFIFLFIGYAIWIPSLSKLRQTETNLAEREEIFRSIVTQAYEAITLIDTESMAFVEFNDAACDLLGYTRNEFAQLRVTDIQAEMEAAPLFQRFPPITGFAIRNIETIHRHKNGSLRNVLVSMKAIELKGRTFMVTTWADITAQVTIQQQLNEANTSLEMTLQAIPDLMFEIDEQGRYLRIYAKNKELLAAQQDALLGHTVREMLPAAAADTVMAALQEAAATGYSHGQVIKLTLPSGDTGWFELSTSVKASTGQGKRFITLSRDITEKKKSEELIWTQANFD